MTAAAQDEELQTLEAALSAEFEPLTVNDERYRGVLAMFGRRCLTLDKYLVITSIFQWMHWINRRKALSLNCGNCGSRGYRILSYNFWLE